MKFQIFSLAAVVLLILSPQVNAKKCTSYYSVIGGDTCGAIATKTKEPLNKLVSDNPGLICNSLAIGDVLCVGYSTTGTFPRLPIPDKKCSVKGTFAITFDDGPFMYTKGLLKYLKSKKLKATFFINGQNYGNIYNYSSSLKQIYKDGHQIAHHTWSHKDITVLSEIELRQEITMLEKAFIDILGVYPRFFRPPYGNTNLASLKILHELGYRVIKWDVTNDDAVGVENGPKTLSQQEMSFISTLNVSGIHPSNDGHISLSHDPKEITAKQFAPWVFNHVKKLGYKTQTVGECLGVPDHADWYRKKCHPNTRTPTLTIIYALCHWSPIAPYLSNLRSSWSRNATLVPRNAIDIPQFIAGAGNKPSLSHHLQFCSSTPKIFSVPRTKSPL